MTLNNLNVGTEILNKTSIHNTLLGRKTYVFNIGKEPNKMVFYTFLEITTDIFILTKNEINRKTCVVLERLT